MSPRHGMPFLVLNYGAEMVYILEQRLLAQQVSAEKGARVLSDVVTAMFAPQFTAELMRPQEMYTPSATKEIFNVLAHSSIMRLSENSMEKLYDLMTMGSKLYYVTARHPTDLIEVTLNHLQGVRSAIANASSTSKAVDDLQHAEAAFVALASTLHVGELAEVRQSLLNFFAGRRVKVSLLLQEKMQLSDGTIVLNRGGEVAHGFEPPGTIRTFDDDGNVSQITTFAYPIEYTAARGPTDWREGRTFPLGYNLYLSARGPKGKPTAPESRPSATTSKSASNAPTVQAAPAVVPSVSKAAQEQSTKALNSLKNLIQVPPQATAVPISLFGDAATGSEETYNPEAPIVIQTISRDDRKVTNAELMGVVDEMKMGGSVGASGGDDLLDLMDRA